MSDALDCVLLKGEVTLADICTSALLPDYGTIPGLTQRI
jgi:hypothetical protein